MNPLISLLKCYGPLAADAEQALEKTIKCIRKKKDDFMLKQGQIVSSLFMLEKGLVRAYVINKDKQVNTWFGVEKMIMGSIMPLYANKPSYEHIQFLEDSEVYYINADDLDTLYFSFPELNIIGRKIAEELCIILEDRISSLHTQSAEERYHALENYYPGILQRVNLGHIASYLGITQETLSRIRKR